jgi:hypothetical protein
MKLVDFVLFFSRDVRVLRMSGLICVVLAALCYFRAGVEARGPPDTTASDERIQLSKTLDP